jgi:phospholipid/cholesterol/gamma-HCH transport system substrate-binding protein
VLSAVAEGLRGNGSAIREATTGANRVLTALNSRSDAIRADWRSLKSFSDTYGSATQNILSILNAASTTSASITESAASLDQLLVGVTGFADSGIGVLEASKDQLITGINAVAPTTALLMKYNPELTCMLVGGKKLLDPESQGGYGYADNVAGRNGNSDILDIALLLGDDAYKYPDNLPIVGAKGGPGGKPGCGSLPDVSQNFPQRYLVTNTGYGTGMDIRPNPGIGFPGYADYFPSTRAVPEPPSVRYPGGPAPGPIPYPGAPPYGAPMYAPDGTPLYPGEPPAPAPGTPRDPGSTPGSEPFVVGSPMQQQPNPAPPLLDQATPAP